MLMRTLGRANGYFSNNLLCRNSANRSAGWTKMPPKDGPNMLPTVQTRGIMLNARGCSSFCGTNSATAVLMIPTFPFDNPCSDRMAKAQPSDLEKPNSTLVTIVQVRASKIIGFLPKRSDALPHAMPVRHCESENTADIRPAHFATWSVGTLKDWIISGLTTC